jgi:argininosuccinate lyase
VLVDLKLFLRAEIINIKQDVKALFDKLIALSNQYKDELLPGYTHLQLAMPSSFGLWFGAYAEGLADDLETLLGAYKVINKNPLGSAAGYGSSFPIDRSMTTTLLGFEQMNYNVVYAQMGRGKSERILAQAMANIAETLGRFSMDVCLYMNQNFGFISFPDELTTGSSIMPHKKNPDVFEIIRGYCSQIKALPNEIAMLTANLPSGYHREMQLLKTHLFPYIQHLKDCLQIAVMMLDNIKIQTNLLQNEKYKYLFSVEEVNKLVNAGMPFRDAYKEIGLAIEAGEFTTDYQVHHTHEGSIGNLCNDEIVAYFQTVYAAFQEHKFQTAITHLLAD